MDDLTTEEELTSWKDIARYLGVTVRTAQLWERERGLPVYRIPGGRSQVRAVIAEVDKWRSVGKSNGAPVTGSGVDVHVAPAHRERIFATRRILPLAVPAVLILAGALWLITSRPTSPVWYRIEHNALVVVDAGGRDVWRKIFPEGLDARFYAGRVPPVSPAAWFGDLDGNGKSEILFMYSAADGVTRELHCYSHDGVLRWRFVPGKSVRTRLEAYDLPFGIEAFQVGRLGPGGSMAVAVSSAHHLWWPGQVVLLDVQGTVLREYWHAGRFSHLAEAIIDGRHVVLCGGVSNARKQATLVVLDAEHWSGASVELNPDFVLEGFAQGQELRRYLFPRSGLNIAFEQYNVVHDLRPHQNGATIEVYERVTADQSTVYYELGPGVTVTGFGASDTFQSQCHRAFLQHLIPETWNQASEEHMRHVTEVVGGQDIDRYVRH